MGLSPLIDRLIETFQILPGVGPKSAQRMALYLLERQQEGGQQLAEALTEALEKVGHCERCRIHTESDLCNICSDPSRDSSQLCIVETPADVLALEHSGCYRGYYFVLLGHLSPLDGIGPDDLGIEQLLSVIKSQAVSEVILATNSTVEGEATAHYLADAMRDMDVSLTRIAHGVPMGGELEYVDSNTLSLALSGRQKMLI